MVFEFNKRGISAVVATVLLILMTIVLIALLWLFMDSYLDRLRFANFGVVLQVNSRDTFYDKDLDLVLVGIKRLEGDLNISEIEVVFSGEGNSFTYVVILPPGPFGSKTYSFNLTRDGVGVIPESVSVAPVVLRNGNEILGEVSGRMKVLKSPLIGDIAHWTCESYYNKLKWDDDPIFVDCDYDGFPRYTNDPDYSDGLDCNDWADWINPGAIEKCDSCVDENCDGLIDMGDPTCYNRIPFDNIVTHYKFDGDAKDEKGINDGDFYDGYNLATIGGNITFEEGVTCGGSSVYFNDGGYMISNNTINNGMNRDEGTISVWFNRRGYQSYNTDSRNYIFTMFNWSEGRPSNRMYIYFEANTQFLGASRGGWPYGDEHRNYNRVVEVPFNEWHHVVLTYNASFPGAGEGEYKVYLDGELEETFIYRNYDLTQQIHFGAWGDYPGYDSTNNSFISHGISGLQREYFNGSLDEAIIFNRSLNASEVFDLWSYY